MLSPVVLDAASSFGQQVINMHRYMITIYGGLMIGGLLVVLFFLLREPEKIESRLSLILAGLAGIQVGSGVLLLLTTQWQFGIQMAFFGIFGLYTAFTCKRDFMRLHAMFSLFFFLAIMGYMTFLGYRDVYRSFDTSAANVACISWFDSDPQNGICFGYISFIRVVIFTLIGSLGLQAFVAYYMYKEEKGERLYSTIGQAS